MEDVQVVLAARQSHDLVALARRVGVARGGQHDAQGEFTYAYLALDKPACVDAPPEGDEFNASTDEPIDRIQMAGEANTKDLPIGKHVVVKGTLFGAHTMWHVEQVLIDAVDVEAK